MDHGCSNWALILLSVQEDAQTILFQEAVAIWSSSPVPLELLLIPLSIGLSVLGEAFVGHHALFILGLGASLDWLSMCALWMYDRVSSPLYGNPVPSNG